MIKRLVAFFLSFVLIFISVPSFAVYDPNPKHSKWFHDSIVNDPLTKSAVEVKAQRTYPVTVTNPTTGAKDTITKAQRSVVKLTPPAANVGKRLMKGGLGGVITQALIGLGVTAVDWLLDPENNAVKYKDPNNPTGGTGGDYYWIVDDVEYDQHDKACQAVYDKARPDEDPKKYIAVNWEGNYIDTCRFLRRATGSYTTYNGYSAKRLQRPYFPGDPSDNGYEYIPIDTVAQQVIRDAAGGDPAAQQVMSDTALDMLEAGLLDTQLQAAAEPKQFGTNQSDPLGGSSPTPDPEPEPEPDPDPDGSGNPNPEPEPSFELPEFCDWAVVVCDFIEWYQEEPDNSDTEIDLPEPDTEDVDTDIDFGGSCPDDFGFTADFRIFQFEFVLMPFSKFCPLLSTYIKPVLVVLGSYMAILIVGGRRDV